MANTYKNIVITPNRSSNTADPKVVYSGGNTTANTDITLNIYPDSNGTLSWEGSAGQLFSITNDLSNNLFGVNDVTGIPYLEVYANGLVSVAAFGGNVVIGNTAEFILSPGTGLHANGSFGTAGQVLTSNASAVYWSTISGVNTSAQYTWTNTHTFQNTITFSSLINTAAINITGQTNTATLFVTTSANLASSNVIANTAGLFVTNTTGVVNAAVHSVGTSTIANSTGVYTGVVNGSSITVGTSTIANSTGVYTGIINAAVHSVGTSTIANSTGVYTGVVNGSSITVGTSTIANSTGVYTGIINAAVHSVGTSFIANTTQVTISGIPLSANGSVGTAGQVLTTNGATGAPYWTAAAAGVNTSASYTWTNVHTFQNTVIFNSNVLVRNNVTTYVGNTTGNGSVINLYVYPDSNGTLSWEGNAGQLFSITNDLSNNLFGVNDVSGIPYIEVYANGLVSIAPISGNVGVRNTAPSHTMSINGDLLVNTDIDIGNSSVNAVVNSTAFLVGNITTGTGGLQANTTRIFVGNNTINAAVNTTTLSIGGTLIANSTGPYGKTESNLNVNSALTANNSTNLGGTAAASYQLNSTLSANVATLSANNASFLGGTAAASYQLNSTLNANIASYLPTYTGVVNASSFTVGTTFTANATLVNTAAINITGQTNTATLFVTTSANLASSNVITNTAGIFVTNTTGVVNAAVHSVGTIFVANTTQTSINSNTTVGNATFANTFLNSFTGISNPQSLTAGVLQTNASLNTLLVGPYTVSSGNSLIVTSGSRLVII